MPTIDTVVIGAGHAGLAVSRLLTDAGREHVVLDRGRIAERWRSERWDSFHLLSPNWMARLPGWWYTGRERDGFLSGSGFVRYLERYAAFFAAPVVERTTVQQLAAHGDGYRVVTDSGTWQARSVVIATGPYGRPHVPDGLREFPVVTAAQYRRPDALPPGGVLVVGASSSGVQIADELASAGREVVLAVGRHTRMPRRYRGMDAYWWLDVTGRLGRTIDDMPDPVAARREPSMQLVGGPRARGEGNLDLGVLHDRGVRLVGRLHEVRDGVARFGGDLQDSVTAADRQMHRFLDVVDRYVERTRLTDEVWEPVRPRPVPVTASPARVDLAREGIGTVVVAAGYRPHHPWLRLPITGPDGQIRQRRGVTPAPGVYVVGQRFQHRRDSAMIDGARHDAWAVVSDIVGRSSRYDLAVLDEGPAA